MAQNSKAMLSDRFVDLVQHASKAARGFFVLGHLDGAETFRNAVFSALREQGWPLKEKGRPDGMECFLRTGILNLENSVCSHPSLKFNLSRWLDEFCDENTQDVFLNEDNYSSLEFAVQTAIKNTAPTFGDPMAVKYNQRSIISAAFQMVAAKMGAVPRETKLSHCLKDMMGVMRIYNKEHKVPFIELQNRVTEELAKSGWGLTDSKDSYGALASELWSLANAAGLKTSLFVHLALQDDTVPAYKADRAAKDFILEHVGDIELATKNICEELDRELATSSGIVLRHCIAVGPGVYMDTQSPIHAQLS